MKTSIESPGAQTSTEDPSVFDFVDYRSFLKAIQDSRKAQNRPASNAAFARKGGIESPNYWGLVLSGKRNLSPLTVQKFSKAVGLSGKPALYFENLVYFNQARSSEEKSAYFDRLKTIAQGQRGQSFRLLSTHVELLSKWYVIAIRELVGTKDFKDDESWIAKRLKNKVSKKEVREALDVLLRLELVERSPEGRLVQAETHLNYKESGANFAVRNLHEQFIDKAKEALSEDNPEHRNITSSTLSISTQKLPAIKKAVDEFTAFLREQFAEETKDQTDSVIQINTQVFFLTETSRKE